MKLKYILSILSSILAFVKADKYLSEKPSFLSSCTMKDANFNKCLASNFQVLFVQWKDGLPGLSNIGKLDPLLVKRVKIVQDNSRALSLNMDLQNVLISGASKGIIQETKLDTKNWVLYVKIRIPRLDFDSDYKIKGNVLALPLNGQGKAKFSSENILLSSQFGLKLRDDGDVTFSEIENAKISVKEIGNFHINVENLFNGQRELEDAANTLFNENWRELYESLRPAIEQTIEAVLEDRLKKVFHYVPANYFVSDIPKAAQIYG